MPGRANGRARETGARGGVPSVEREACCGAKRCGAAARPRVATRYFSSFQSLKYPYVMPMTGMKKKNHQVMAP